ncbi:hypothetical protein [Microbacterium sp. NPDC076911]|uniref:hypothetical protein n=1 Tax=Microbacterium sp. NPDC076911 TaxID=3154958 RepID=UPI0034462ED0
MKVCLNGVSKGRKQRALPEISGSYESGRATLMCAETEQRPTVLGLIATGRMKPDTGTVTLDSRKNPRAMRRLVALVDAPGVSEPEANVQVGGVVAEELMFAGRRSDPFAVRTWLAQHGLESLVALPISNVAPRERLRMLCELALLRRGTDAIVLVSPDRHGGEPAVWWNLAQELAARGLGVLVIAGRASHAVIDESPSSRRYASRAPSPSGMRLRRMIGGKTR